MTDRPLPTGWISGQLANFIKPRGEKVSPSDFPEFKFIGMDNIESQTTKILGSVPAQTMKSNASRFYEGDVLYGRLRPYLNKVAQVNFHGLASAEFIVFPDTPILKSFYLKYRLNAADFVSFASHLNEGDRPRVSFDQIGTFNLLLPPLAEQQRIVDKIEELFSDLDDGIASLKKAQQQLKVYRQAVLKWAFEGKLTAQWREEQKRQGKLESADTLLEQIKAEREQRYQVAIDQWQADVKAWEANGKVGKKPGKPSKLGEIVSPEEAIKQSLIDLPKNWFWVGVDSLCSKVVDCLHSTPKFKGEGFYCVDTTCIEPGKIVFQKIRFVDEDTFLDRIKRLEPQAGDILFAREGTVGTALLVPKNISLCLGQRMMMFRTLNSIDPSFFMYALQSPIFINQYKPYIGGTTSPHLNISDIKSFFLPVVQLDEQNQIVEEIESRLSICDRLDATITENLDRAEALRQSILKQAFEGKLVPQDPNDEPASVLLERIRQEQAKGKGGIPNG